jgi:hypothetical protein
VVGKGAWAFQGADPWALVFEMPPRRWDRSTFFVSIAACLVVHPPSLGEGNEEVIVPIGDVWSNDSTLRMRRISGGQATWSTPADWQFGVHI